jgi:hypothetical protein
MESATPLDQRVATRAVDVKRWKGDGPVLTAVNAHAGVWRDHDGHVFVPLVTNEISPQPAEPGKQVWLWGPAMRSISCLRSNPHMQIEDTLYQRRQLYDAESQDHAEDLLHRKSTALTRFCYPNDPSHKQ